MSSKLTKWHRAHAKAVILLANVEDATGFKQRLLGVEEWLLSVRRELESDNVYSDTEQNEVESEANQQASELERILQDVRTIRKMHCNGTAEELESKLADIIQVLKEP